MRIPKKKFLFTCLLCLPVPLCLLMAEMGLRWYLQSTLNEETLENSLFWSASNRIHRESDDERLIYELVPNSSTTREGVEVTINSAGFRDHEFPATVPQDATRIVILGDSVAWGWQVAMRDAFPQRLESRLHESSRPAVVYNLAVDGYSTQQEIRLLETRGLAYAPDTVILAYVLNDPDTQDGGLARYFQNRIELWHSTKLFFLTAKARLQYGAFPFEYHHRVHAIFKKQIQQNFHQLGQISRQHNIPIMVAVIPVFLNEAHAHYPYTAIHKEIESLCHDNDLCFVDLYSTFEGEMLWKFAFDAWHPNEEGHQRIADHLFLELQ